jgi:hypothetical protein
MSLFGAIKGPTVNKDPADIDLVNMLLLLKSYD